MVAAAAPLSLDAPISPDDPNHDWSLGRYMPSLALHEESETQHATGKTKRGWFGRATSRDETPRSSSQPGVLIVLLAALLGPFMKSKASKAQGTTGAETLNDGAPVHGVLGRFNRYMALQEYVILDPNDPEWKDLKGWRGFLRRFGIRVAVRKADLDASRPPRRLIPWPIQRRIGRAIGQTLRVVCIAAPVLAFLLCLHAGMRVQQHAKAWVFQIKGHPTVTRNGKKTPLHYGDVLDGVDMPTLSTDGKSELGLQLADSRVQLAPATTLRIAQMDYANGARERRLELVSGQAMMMVEPEANRDLPGHYDLMVEDAQVRALPTDSPLTLSVNYHLNTAKVAVSQGVARVSQQGAHKMVTAGEQIVAQKAQPLTKPSSMSAHDRNTLAAQTASLHPSVASALSSSLPPTISATLSPSLPSSFEPGLMQPLLAHWASLYSDVQEKTFMPFVDHALTLCHLKPESESALNEAKALTTARISLDALVKALVASDMPATLDLKTLEETGLDAKDRTRILDSFAEHRVLAYRRLENGSLILLARANNENHTLLKAHDGLITMVPEVEEDRELKGN